MTNKKTNKPLRYFCRNCENLWQSVSIPSFCPRCNASKKLIVDAKLRYLGGVKVSVLKVSDGKKRMIRSQHDRSKINLDGQLVKDSQSIDKEKNCKRHRVIGLDKDGKPIVLYDKSETLNEHNRRKQVANPNPKRK
jgi:hypothetical protein